MEKPNLYSLEITDTHAHLYASQFDNERDQMMQRCFDTGVSRIFLPNIDVHSIQPMLDLVWKYPENCFPMMGLHPCSVDEHVEAHLFQIQKWFKKRKFYAVGEIGLDYYWSVEFKDAQIAAFKKQIQWAIQQDLPIVIHSRNSTNDCIAVLQELMHPRLRGIFHCFSGNALEAKTITDMGFYLGIGGVLTYKNSGLDAAIEDIPLEKLVLETDAPYLAPNPHRGKRNETAYIIHVAQKLAELKHTSLAVVATITTQNSKELFGI
jgi:TatD DNase family protein